MNWIVKLQLLASHFIAVGKICNRGLVKICYRCNILITYVQTVMGIRYPKLITCHALGASYQRFIGRLIRTMGLQVPNRLTRNSYRAAANAPSSYVRYAIFIARGYVIAKKSRPNEPHKVSVCLRQRFVHTGGRIVKLLASLTPRTHGAY